MKLNMLLAMIVISNISLSAMEERELVVAPGKSKEATKRLHDCFKHVYDNAEFQGEKLHAKFEQFLKEGADPNAEAAPGCTVLKRIAVAKWASQRGLIPSSLIPLVVQYGAEIDKKSGQDQTNALHVACSPSFAFDNYEIVRMLLECGAKVNARDRHERTPLNLKKYCVDTKSIELLLIWGAEPFTQYQWGKDIITEGEYRYCISSTLQALLAFKEVATKKGERYVRNADGKLVGKRDESGTVQLKTIYMESLPPEIIENIFKQVGFVYPHRRKIEVINVQVEEQSN